MLEFWACVCEQDLLPMFDAEQGAWIKVVYGTEGLAVSTLTHR